MSVRVGPYEFDQVHYDPADILSLSMDDARAVGDGDAPDGDAWLYSDDGSDHVVGLVVMWPRQRLKEEGRLLVTLPDGEQAEVEGAAALLR
jgi:hypothetical protein